ncbi:MAG: putative secreted protein [Candidatus Phytoplasma cynodontis]|nr:MAG: putative secreted protein [Candidatus Phytoplasma cynodontis]
MLKKKLKNNFFLKKNIILFLFHIIFILSINFFFNFNFIYAIENKNVLNNDDTLIPLIENNNKQKLNNNFLLDEDIDISSYAECSYRLNSKKKYICLGWKHDSGSFFSKKVNFFYGIDNIKLLPCSSFKEWLNLKQLFFVLINYHIPKMNLLFNIIDFFHFKEEFIDQKYDRIALDTSHFCYFLKKDPSLGCFYFKEEDLKYIDSFNISLCNCKVSGYSILELILEITHLKDKEERDIFLKHLFDYLNYLNKKFDSNYNESDSENKKSSEKINISIENLLDKISENIDIDSIDKNLISHLIKNLIRCFAPKFFLINFSVDKNDINKKPSKEYRLDISLKPEHKTIGCLLEMKKDLYNNNFYIYFNEIFRIKEDNTERLNLIKKILIFTEDINESNLLDHLIISITKQKKYLNKKIILLGADKK